MPNVNINRKAVLSRRKLTPVPLGNIIVDSFSPQTGTYTAFGTGVITVTSGNLALTGGNGTFNNGMILADYQYNAEQMTVEFTYTLASSGSGSFGTFFGHRSTNPSQNQSIYWGLYNFSANNTVHFRLLNNAQAFMYDGGNFTVNAGDSVTVRAIFGSNSVIFEWANNTLSTSGTYTYTYNYDTPIVGEVKVNSGQIRAYAGSVTTNIQNITISSLGYKYADLAFIGDSITAGYNTSGSGSGRFTQLYSDSTGRRTMIFSGAADNTQAVLNCMSSIVLFRPTRVHLLIGTNDVVLDYAGFQTRYPQVVSALEAVGCIVYPCLLMPRNTFDVTTANAWITSTFGSNHAIIDYFTVLKDTVGYGYNPLYSNDGLHPNSAGAVIMKNKLLTYI